MGWQQINGKPFRKKDEQNLQKAVKRFNSKLRRLIKKYENEDNVMLPELLSVKNLKQSLQDRRDLNNFYKSVERFMKRGSEELMPPMESGIRMTKYQRNEIRIGIIRSKANLRSEISRIENIDDDTGDVSKDYTRFRLKNEEKENLQNKIKSLNNVETRDKQSLEKLIERIDRYKTKTWLYNKNKVYKENYLQALENTFKDNVEGYDQLVSLLDDVDVMDFYSLIADNDILSDIKQYYKGTSFISDKEFDENLQGKFNEIMEEWVRRI